MNTYIEYLAIATIVVYIVDLSGFTESWKGWLTRLFKGKEAKSIKPFDCSLCMTWWTLLLVSLLQGTFTPAMCAYIAGLSFVADLIGQTLQIVKELLKMVLRYLYKLTQL